MLKSLETRFGAKVIPIAWANSPYRNEIIITRGVSLSLKPGGGGRDYREAYLGCAVREIWEEMKLYVHPSRLIPLGRHCELTEQDSLTHRMRAGTLLVSNWYTFFMNSDENPVAGDDALQLLAVPVVAAAEYFTYKTTRDLYASTLLPKMLHLMRNPSLGSTIQRFM